MLTLAIETSTTQSSIALAGPDGILAAASLGVARRHGEFVSPAIEFCLRQAGAGTRDITGIAVGLGPGSYTGLRVGIATAQTMALALRVPVVGMSALDILAFQMRHSRDRICAAIDARRNEVFWAFYDCAPGGVLRTGEMCVGSAADIAAEMGADGQRYVVIGDGATRHAEHLRDAGAHISALDLAFPRAEDLAALAVPRFIREETQRPDELLPIYLRQPDAKIGWQQRGRLRPGAKGA